MDRRELALEDYISILRRRWPVIVALAIVGCGLGFATAHFLPKRYTSQTLVLVQQPRVPDEYVKPVVTEDTTERLATMQQEILSRTRLEPVIRQFGLYRDDINRVSVEDLVARLREAIIVTPLRPMAETRTQGLPGFTVSVEFYDARLAQQICSTITSMFMEENLKVRENQAEQTTQFLAKQLEDAKAKLDEQDAKLATFQRQYLGLLPEDGQTNINVLQGLNSRLDATTQEISRAQQDKNFAASELNQQLTTWQDTQDGHNPQTQEQELVSLEKRLTDLESEYTDNYPDVIRVKSDIEALKKKIAASNATDTNGAKEPNQTPRESAQIQLLRAQIHQIDGAIKGLTTEQAQLQQRIKLYQSRIEASPAVDQQYKQLTRDYQTALDFYNELLKKSDQSAMATDLERRQEGEQFQVLDPANLPNNPSFPKKLNFGLGGLAAGLGLACGLTAFWELRDTSIKNERDIETFLRLSVLATVPIVRPPSERKGSASSVAGRMKVFLS